MSAPDAAYAALTVEGQQSLDADRVYRRIALRLLPFLFICYVVSYLDRANVGFAKLQFTADLGLSEAAFGLGAGLFYVGYVLFEVPSNFYLEKAGVRATLVRIMVAWGLISTLMSIITSAQQYYWARILLGAAEAGFFPGVVLYLSYWFPAARRARITSMFLLAVIVAGMSGGLVSGWIMKETAGWFGLKGWQVLFIVEGIPAVLLGIAAIFVLDDKPADARWLSASEKDMIRRDLEADRQGRPPLARHGFMDAFKDPRVYIAGLIFALLGSGSTIVQIWYPTIIKAAGVEDLAHVTLLTMLPYAATGIAIVLIGRRSDRMQERRWHMAIPAAIGGIAFLLMGLPNIGLPATMLLLCVAAAANYSAVTVFWTIPPAYLSGPSAAAGIALISSIGSGLGGFGGAAAVGWLKTATGTMFAGLAAVCVAVLCAALLTLVTFASRAGTTAGKS
jgi:ACS family phthalate transporter-like MFS transporter